MTTIIFDEPFEPFDGMTPTEYGKKMARELLKKITKENFM